MASPNIENYRFGRIVITGNAYTKDVIIFSDRVMANWWREQGHRLSIPDLKEVVDAEPEVLVIGRGSVKRMKVPPQVQEQLEKKGIRVIAQSTDEAVQTYNRLREKKDVVAALHLTC